MTKDGQSDYIEKEKRQEKIFIEKMSAGINYYRKESQLGGSGQRSLWQWVTTFPFLFSSFYGQIAR